MRTFLTLPLLCIASALHAQPIDEKPATAEQLAFFEKKIRPVLVTNCYGCHAGEKVKGGLSLDTRDGLRKGGDSGPAVSAGDKNSLILVALQHQKDDFKMPPKEKLPDAVVEDFVKWVVDGAADPRVSNGKTAKGEIDLVEGRKFWAYQPPKATAAPTVRDKAWPLADMDRYLLAALEAKNLKPNPDAEPATLLRRVTFDLTGLPPTPEQVAQFVKNPNSLPAVVDVLLASPAFGERWGRHWLDVARYGETSGRATNITYPFAWRYRDYVIDAFNADRPYDEFIREQLAGDLLKSDDAKVQARRTAATAFLAIGPKDHNQRKPIQFDMDNVDEMIDTTFQTFMGLTVACARCHDHKFDPIPTRDYYALAGIFKSTELCFGTFRNVQNQHPSSFIDLGKESGFPAPQGSIDPSELAKLHANIDDLKKQRTELTRDPNGTRNIMDFIRIQAGIASNEAKIAQYRTDGTGKPLTMGVRDKVFPKDSPLYIRGEAEKPGAIVPRGFLQVLEGANANIRRGTSGRKELADWIASPKNPLTARVMVNRVWLHLFGKGIVASPDNFGMSGRMPSHPELLDRLALDFARDGWSVKKLVRSIVLSRAYRMDSRSQEVGDRLDPDNTLVWRMNPRRLEAEAIRDAMLAVSGRLTAERPSGSPVMSAPERPGGAGLIARGYEQRDTHRSVYLPVMRDLLPDTLALFDFPDPTVTNGERATTNVPAQALYLLNSPQSTANAEAFAQKLKEYPSDEERIRQAYLRAFAREATTAEVDAAMSFFREYEARLATDKISSYRRQKMAWVAFCQALFAAAEFSQLR